MKLLKMAELESAVEGKCVTLEQ